MKSKSFTAFYARLRTCLPTCTKLAGFITTSTSFAISTFHGKGQLTVHEYFRNILLYVWVTGKKSSHGHTEKIKTQPDINLSESNESHIIA